MSPITTSVPASMRRPGAFHEFKFLESGQQLVALPLRVVIVAEKTTAGAATADTPVQIFDETDSATKLGAGSMADLMAKKALEQAKISPASPEIWVAPVVAPVGAAAVQTITTTVTTALAGAITLRIAGRTLVIGVSAGDAQNTIATAIKAKLDEVAANLPFTAGVAANVVTCTARTHGVNGNDVAFEVIAAPGGVTVATAQTVAGAGALAITNAINALNDRRYHAIALSNHAVGDAAAILAWRTAAWLYNAKNYAFAFLGERGTLGTAQTLQASFNDFGVIVTSCEGSPSLPGEIAICTAVAEFARELPNANLDGARLALVPPSGALAYTAPEIESALNGGVTPLTPDGAFVKIERLVTTQITSGGAPFEPLRDIAYPRTSSWLAEQVDAGYLSGFKAETFDDDPDTGTLARVRDMVIEKQRAAAGLKVLRDVDTFIPQIQVTLASSPAGRLVVSNPHRVAGPLHQGVFVHTMYL